MNRASDDRVVQTLYKKNRAFLLLIVIINVFTQQAEAFALQNNTSRSLHTLVEAVVLFFPEKIPVPVEDLSRSTLFTLREAGKPGSLANNRECLNYKFDPGGAGEREFLMNYFFSGLAVSYVFSLMYGSNLASNFFGIAILSLSLNELVERNLFRSGIIVMVGSYQFLYGVTQQVGEVLGISMIFYELFRIYSEGLKPPGIEKLDLVSIEKQSCIKKKDQGTGQLFRMERYGNAWSDFGVLTPVNRGLRSAAPMCLTKQNDKTIDLKACSFTYDAAGRKIVEPGQVWAFKAQKQNPESSERVVKRLVSFLDDGDCLAGVVSTKKGVASKCLKLTLGKGFAENGCVIYPDGRPSSCSRRKSKNKIPLEYRGMYVEDIRLK
ncbi:hypothetical protein [Endozoicomonas arenosclerae]|uniref:hypothetical protein n=1 Tax=Endozoicomonas arenosclerae TaxID=1633495 RepID=UPI000783520A|nr:hypothetical protein [Endozoicomonas arenosclerae]